MLWLSSAALVYHEAELWGAALAWLGFDRVVAWWSTRRGLDLLGAGALAALALSTRPSSGMGPALALGGLAVVLAVQRAVARPGAWCVGAAAVPFLLYALRQRRCASATPFSVPFDRQVLNEFSADRRAALADNGGTLFGRQVPANGPRAVPAAGHDRAPGAGAVAVVGRPADLIGGVTFDTVDRSASLAGRGAGVRRRRVVGVVATIRRRVAGSVGGVDCVAAAVAVVPTLAIAFIAQRYLADFVPVLVVGAALGVPAVAAWAAGSGGAPARVLAGDSRARRRRPDGRTRAWPCWPATCTCCPTRPSAATSSRCNTPIQDACGGGRRRTSQRVERLGEVGPDGAVAIVGDCDGLYRSDGETWRLLEQRRRRVAQRAVVRGATLGPVVTGDGWQIVLGTRATDRRLEYVGATRVDRRRDPRHRRDRVDVAADPMIPTVIVDVDGERSFEAFLQTRPGPSSPPPAGRPAPSNRPSAATSRLAPATDNRAVQRGSRVKTNW